jgi:2-oxoglutarate dehydrogenase complex dehydrogenase (E1) component-like enzyme
MNDKVLIGLVPDLKRKAGFLKFKTCTLIILEKQLIFAHSTQKLRNTFKNKTIDAHYHPMTVKKILGESPENFSLQPKDIVRIRLMSGEIFIDASENGPDKLAIRTHDHRYNFVFGPKSPSFERVKALLEKEFAPLMA